MSCRQWSRGREQTYRPRGTESRLGSPPINEPAVACFTSTARLWSFRDCEVASSPSRLWRSNRALFRGRRWHGLHWPLCPSGRCTTVSRCASTLGGKRRSTWPVRLQPSAVASARQAPDSYGALRPDYQYSPLRADGRPSHSGHRMASMVLFCQNRTMLQRQPAC